MTARRGGALLLATVLLAATLAACGVQRDDQPRALDPQNVPYSLLAPTSTVPAPVPVGEGEGTSRVLIYLVGVDGLLWPRSRAVRGQATVEKSLTALLAGTSEEEADLQYTSFIAADTALLGVAGPTDGLVVVNLSRELLTVTGRRQIQALAQVVFTATSLPAVDRVLFEFDGELREVPNGEGELTATPVGRRHYEVLDRGAPQRP